MADTIKYRFRCRRRTKANWEALNEILLPQEIGIESDTSLGKIGDGITPWNSLYYSIIGGVDLAGLGANRVLKRDAFNTKWIVADESGGGGGGSDLSTLTDMVTLLPGQIPIPTGKLSLLQTVVDGVGYAIPAYQFDPTDPYIDKVIAMTFFDGANGSSAIVDAIGGLPWHTMNGPTIDATVQPFPGVNSLKVIKTQLVYIDLTGALIGDQDYTIECMVNLSTTATFEAWWRLIILTDLAGGQGDLQLSNNSTSDPPNMRGVINTNGTIMWSTSGNISRGDWHHIEYSRKGNTYRYFRDGTLAASYTTSTAHNFTRPILSFNGTPNVTAGTSANGAEGNYAMLRVTVGVARHDANFTPPWARYQTT